jgi:small-conductance mechanosensitive channel
MPLSATTAWKRPHAGVSRLLAAGALTLIVTSAAAQTPSPEPRQPLDLATATAAANAATPGPPVDLTYANRFIVQFRSTVLGRPPADRVAVMRGTLDQLVATGITEPVQTRRVGPVAVIEVGGHFVAAILPSDVDALRGETVDSVAAAARGRLDVALREVRELSLPWELLQSVALVLLATLFFGALGWLLVKAHRIASRRITHAAEQSLRTVGGDDTFLASSRILEYLPRLIGFLSWGLGLFFLYSWLTFSLRRFPYTRPWGESLRTILLAQLSRVGSALLEALPGLTMVLIIALIARFAARVLQLFFHAVEQGRVTVPWIYPETAQPTRRLVMVLLWLFALVMAYPYLPGSDSEAFKGMSVFVGLVISLGSTGVVTQVMSGFTLTYSRALRVGDYVNVGDVEGTVTQMGMLSTKVKTPLGADVTIPNAVMVSQNVTNYSRFADTEGVFVTTQVTIGYDTPWRQVEGLLLLAASRSAGVRKTPAPRVRQAALEDFYIRYTLLFALENPTTLKTTLGTVHANILDAFNEYGVQITSPNYEADPGAAKVVPRERWFAAPAVQSGEGS